MLGGGLSASLRNYINNTLSVNSFPINSPESIELGNVNPLSVKLNNQDNVSAKFGIAVWGITQITSEYKPSNLI